MTISLPQIKPATASLYAAAVFISTMGISYSIPEQSIVLSGLLIVIFLSVFVRGGGPTIIAGFVSAFAVAVHILLRSQDAISLQEWTHYIFLIFLFLLTTLIVLYIKKLILRMQFDKSHIASLFENATEGFVVTNSAGDIVLVNPSACRMFDYTAEELVGQKIEILIPRSYKQHHVQLRDGFYNDPKNRVMGHGRDLHGEKKGGKTFPVEVSLSTYTQQDERYVIAFIVDITHRKSIERNVELQQRQLERITDDMRRLNAELEAKVEERTVILKEALQRLEQSQEELSQALDKERQLNEIKSRFVSMASHEFRTPLSTVLSSASLLTKYTTTEEQDKRTRHVEKIKASVKHLNDLLEDFLSLGRLDEGKIGASLNEFDLRELMRDTVDEMSGFAKEGQRIEYRYSGNEVLISDKKLVKNILINLISNALKFSGNEGKVLVSANVGDNEAFLTVKDEGIGIPAEDQPHLFSTFFRGKNATNIQGTGLGLHIVKRYVELLNGQIQLESKVGQGTTISISIPVNKTDL